MPPDDELIPTGYETTDPALDDVRLTRAEWEEQYYADPEGPKLSRLPQGSHSGTGIYGQTGYGGTASQNQDGTQNRNLANESGLGSNYLANWKNNYDQFGGDGYTSNVLPRNYRRPG